jgi:hypothetical protein
MTAILRKFPSIDQYKNVITNIRQYCKKHDKPIPTLRFEGTIKLHGTNGGIGYDATTDEIWAQSRERIITPYDDNAAFAKYVEANKDALKAYLRAHTDETGLAYLFGEWAGPNVQKGVAISQIPAKSFFAFELLTIHREDDGTEHVHYGDLMLGGNNLSHIPDTYRIGSFQTHHMDIDFSRPQDFQNELVRLTDLVEENCPVAAEFGQSGIGEGIVWHNRETGLRFKVKGEKHSVSKVSTVKPISEADLERIKTIGNFVDVVVTDNRLEQGLSKLTELGKPHDITSTGDFIKWVVGDVLKEEMDLIIASMLDKKELNPAMSNKAKNFYMNYIKSQDAIAA